MVAFLFKMKPSLLAAILLAILARCLLISSGVGGFLSSRIEVSTPANSAVSIREGVFISMQLPLLTTGKHPPSPYWGESSGRMPPLLIKLFTLMTPQQWNPISSILYVSPLIAADVVASLMLRGALSLQSSDQEKSWSLTGLDGIAMAYLFNPFSIMSCVAGTSSPLENLAVVGAVLAAVLGRSLATAFCIALGSYLGVQPLFLIVPAAVLLNNKLSGRNEAFSIIISILRLAIMTGIFLVALIGLSDMTLSSHPMDQCLTQIWRRGSITSCWANKVYGLHLFIADGEPNIGVFWYFFLMMFSELRSFFAFVSMALIGAFLIPMAIRFPTQGLFLVVIQVGISTMLRPYPSVGDLGLFVTLLLLIQETTNGLRNKSFGLLLVNSLLLLSVLGPAMWHQWISVESANSNFFYSITLILGIWHVALLSKLVQIKSKEIEKL